MTTHTRAKISYRGGPFFRERRIVCTCGWKSSWHYASSVNNKEFEAHKETPK